MNPDNFGLGRLPAPDGRDTRFQLRTLADATPPSTLNHRYWWANGWHGNQANLPWCVAFSFLHYLADGPVTHKGRPQPLVSPADLYRTAQENDEWDGTAYAGTSVRAGAKVLQSLGYVSSYWWGWDVATVVDALLSLGPVVVGTNWYSGMFDVDEKGLIGVNGRLSGGHAYVLNGVNRKRELVRLKNSWGKDWGNGGMAWLSFEDLGRLLSEDGEACLAVEAVKA